MQPDDNAPLDDSTHDMAYESANSPADTTSSPAPPAEAVNTRLDFDITCIQCGYNLRGQDVGASCSECGTPVVHSLRTDQLCQANVGWLASLRSGMTWMIVGICASFGMVALAMFVGVAVSASASSSGGFVAGQPIAMLIFGVISNLVLTVVFAVALWLTTQPEPGAMKDRTSRRLARWTLLASLCGGTLASIIQLGQTEVAEIVSSLFQLINLCLIAVGFPSYMLYLRTLANRIPDPGLARQTLIVMWGVFSCIGVFIGAALLTLFISLAQGTGSYGPPGAILGLFGIVFCFTLIGLAVFGIWWIVQVCQYRARFARALQIARSHHLNAELREYRA